MAVDIKYLVPILFFVGFSILEGYCVNGQSGQSTTPWPELGARRRTQSQPQATTASPKRDFVPQSQPSAWNKPLTAAANPANPAKPVEQQQKAPSSPTRDYVNPNIQLSYSNAAGPAGNNKPSQGVQGQNANIGGSSQTRPASPTRDYVNPNVQLSYSNIAGGTGGKPVTPGQNPNQNQNQNQKPAAIPIQPQSPPRDYVNPNAATATGKPSYSNVVKPTNNNPGSPALPQASTTPASRVPGSNNNNGNTASSTTPSPKDENSELREFSESLLRKDTNNGFKHVKVNYQGMTRSSSMKDEAPENLMTIDPAAFKIPTVEKLVALHNNYLIRSNENEVYTAQERVEENTFLDAILSTPVMQHTRNFLISKGKVSKDPKDFKDILRTIWFNMYSRGGGKIGSSGFEHVYLTEIKNDVISGMHNWIYFNEEEKKKTANYLGYMKKLEFDKGAILKFHFNFQSIDKPVGSMFIGTSPEFELALYSTCFLVRPDDVCPLRLGGKNFVIRTYTYRYRGKNMIGSAFPEI